MKTIQNYLIPLLVVVLFLPVSLGAQSQKEQEELEKQKKEMQKEFQKQQREAALELERQKLDMEAQLKREQSEMNREIERMLRESKIVEEEELRALLENQKDVQKEAYEKYHDALEKLNKSQQNWTVYPDVRIEKWDSRTPLMIKGEYYGMERETSSLNISKDVEDLTFSTSFTYEVKEGTSSFRFAASGTVSAGTIRIQLTKPNRELAHEFDISPLADVNWSQEFQWNEEEAEGYQGQWTIRVSAEKATGRYRVSVQSH